MRFGMCHRYGIKLDNNDNNDNVNNNDNNNNNGKRESRTISVSLSDCTSNLLR